MFDIIYEKLQAKRCELVSRWNNRQLNIREVLQDSLQSNDWHALDSLPTIAKENIIVATQFRDTINTDFYSLCDESICLLLHGSTAHGRGQINPNIDHEILYGTNPQMKTVVIPDCRDDLDLILLVNHPDLFKKRVQDLANQIFQNGIDVTINLISWEVFWDELKDSGTPAIRRIINLNEPVVLLGQEHYKSVENVALQFESWLDLPHELDFRLLMNLALILTSENMYTYTFTTSQLLELFPTFYLAGKENVHIGFPKKRIKIMGN